MTAPPAENPWSDLPDMVDWAEKINQPYDDAPAFDAETDPEVNTAIRLKSDRAFMHVPARRFMIDYRANADAYKHLENLPAQGESLHGIISGKYALFEMVAALIERRGKIDTLHIATLSFSKKNAADLLELFDAGHIARVNLLVSYYFKSTSRPIYDLLVPQLRERKQKVLAMRTHAKMLLVKHADGSAFTVEASANLRSSQNIEQFVMTADAALYEFHRTWMDEELLNGVELGKD